MVRLAAAGHPYGLALSGVPIGTGPAGLLEAEAALVRTWAHRVVTGARRAGSTIRRWAAEELDVVNALACLVPGAAPPPDDGSTVLVEGGTWLTRAEATAILRMPPARRPAAVRDRCTLGDLDREYTLEEIAIITRAAPARMLGLSRKGHLGPGADADITIYAPHDDKQRMFELPRYVIHAGQIVVDNGQILEHTDGRLLHVAPHFDAECVPDIQNWFEENYSIQFRNYPVDPSYLHTNEVIPSNGPRE